VQGCGSASTEEASTNAGFSEPYERSDELSQAEAEREEAEGELQEAEEEREEAESGYEYGY
jgi:hypothetical protein